MMMWDNRQNVRYSLGFLLTVLGTFGLVAQSNVPNRGGVVFDIIKAEVNEEKRSLDFFLSTYEVDAAGNLEALITADKNLFTVEEYKKDNTEPENLLIDEIEYITENVAFIDSEVYLLIEASMSMHKNGYTRMQTVIKSLFDSKTLHGQTVNIAWYSDNIVGGDFKTLSNVSFDNFSKLEKGVNEWAAQSKLSVMFEALYDNIQRKGGDKKNKVLLFTDGQSVDASSTDLQEALGNLTSIEAIEIYPILVGNSTSNSFFKNIVDETQSISDEIQRENLSQAFLQGIIKGSKKSLPNLKVSTKLIDATFQPLEEREYKIKYSINGEGFSDRKKAVINSSTGTVDIRPLEHLEYNVFSVLLIGLFIIAGLLLFFWLLIPTYNRFHFKKNHIKKYASIKKAGVRANDPLTLEEIKDDETVVVMGKKIMLLETWKYLKEHEGETSKDHAIFFKNQLSGNFFSQSGDFQRLNWVWFGALGGYLAWCIGLLFKMISIDFYLHILESWLDTPQKQISSAVYDASLTGVAMGIGIVLALALVDELGSSRSFRISSIIKRILIGAVVGLFVFLVESYLTASFLNSSYIGGLIGWTIFGTFIGLTVTFFSSIELKNGVIGGFISGVIAFHFYYLFQTAPFFIDVFNASFAQMFSFIIYGCVLGYVIFKVVFRLEDFDITFLSPEAFYGRKNPISKWLKSDSYEAIYIGTDPGCEITIKWSQQDDKAVLLPRHARLTYDDGLVSIEPLEKNSENRKDEKAELLINNNLVNRKTILNDKDRIRLGLQSISLMEFNARKKGSKEQSQRKVIEKDIAVRISKK